MKIYTGNFANVKKYKLAGLHPISIALSARYFNGDLYRKLNPEWAFKDYAPQKYIPLFMNKMGKLNPDKVIKDLAEISNGKDVVLLCHEKEDDFCHRHLVAAWLSKEKKIQIKELGKMERKQIELF